jgi:hypothetical protein
MFPVVGLLEETNGGGKEDNDRERIILNISHLFRNETQQNMLRTAE